MGLPLLLAGVFALLTSANSQASEIGRQKSEAGRCQECHGADGLSVDAKIPNHAGQYAGYLGKQLADFQSGARKHDIMNIMAEDLNAADIADIGAYFAEQNAMRGDGSGGNPLGRQLFNNGDPARGIPACAGCHGDNGKGRVNSGVIYPVIGGQRKVYLRSQLVNWKLGERGNSPGGVMNAVAKPLSEQEIEALADYLSGL